MSAGEYIGAGSGITKGLYHLNGDATDSSGNANNGTATNVTWVGGKVGSGAGSFNGSSSEISVTDNAGLRLTVLTAGIWLYMGTQVSGKEQIAFRKDTQTTRNLWCISRPTGTDNIIARVYNGTDYSINFSGSQGVWYHAMFTLTGSSGILSLYINGEFISSMSIGILSAPQTNLYIGNHCHTSGDAISANWNGILDEFIIENRVWTYAEIKKYYTMSKGRFGIL